MNNVKVEGALLELSRKQAELEQREKEFESTTQMALVVASAPSASSATATSSTGLGTTGSSHTGAAATSILSAGAQEETHGSTHHGALKASSSAGAQAVVTATPQSNDVEAPTGGLVTMEAVDATNSAVEAAGAVVPAGAGGGDWVEYWDESAGASYFFNTITQVGDGRLMRSLGAGHDTAVTYPATPKGYSMDTIVDFDIKKIQL